MGAILSLRVMMEELPLASWPGLSRSSTFFTSGEKKKDVDVRDKPGHDVERFVSPH
jgi:hypothetical protein